MIDGNFSVNNSNLSKHKSKVGIVLLLPVFALILMLVIIPLARILQESAMPTIQDQSFLSRYLSGTFITYLNMINISIPILIIQYLLHCFLYRFQQESACLWLGFRLVLIRNVNISSACFFSQLLRLQQRRSEWICFSPREFLGIYLELILTVAGILY